MSKPDYTQLDAAILEVIQALGPITFSVLGLNVHEHSVPFAYTDRQGRVWRVVDRRLKALRKAGKIKYSRNPEGWTLA